MLIFGLRNGAGLIVGRPEEGYRLQIVSKMDRITEAERLFYDNYEKTLTQGLVKLCKSAGMLGDELLSSPDIEEVWDRFISDYIADAVHQFNDYPEAAVAWPGFIGIAVAHRWDEDWEKYKTMKYKDLYGPNGWDDMDESILHFVLGLDLASEEATRLAQTLKSCSLAALALIRHEGVEAQTARGFYVLARTYSVLFRIGAALELFRLKYKMKEIHA